MTNICPKCSAKTVPFRDKFICLKCGDGMSTLNCDSCNGKELVELPCKCVQCKSCPRINPQFCKDHLTTPVIKTYVDSKLDRFVKWVKKDHERLFILNSNEDIVYTEHI